MSMTLQAIPGIRIAGVANAWPEDLLGVQAQFSNEQVYAAFLGPQWRKTLQEKQWNPERPAEMFGVKTRGWTRGTNIGSLELGIAAAEMALNRAGVKASELDCIFFASCSPFQITSTLAGKLAHHLRCDAAAIDLRAGGAGGLNSLATAALYHANGCKASLVVAAEASSQLIGQHDLANGLLFGDGASALVLVSDSSANNAGLVGAVMGNAHWHGKAFTVPGRLPPTPGFNPQDYLFQAPDATYRACLANTWETTSARLREAFPAQTQSLDAILPYAVTKEQVLNAAMPFNAPANASLKLLEAHGCTGCASPLGAMVTYIEDKLLQKHSLQGDLVGSLAVAGGISWSGLLWRF